MDYDRAYWEQLWAKTLREHPDKVAHRPPNAHLIAEIAAETTERLDALLDHVGRLKGVQRTMSSIVLSVKADR